MVEAEAQAQAQAWAAEAEARAEAEAQWLEEEQRLAGEADYWEQPGGWFP